MSFVFVLAATSAYAFRLENLKESSRSSSREIASVPAEDKEMTLTTISRRQSQQANREIPKPEVANGLDPSLEIDPARKILLDACDSRSTLACQLLAQDLYLHGEKEQAEEVYLGLCQDNDLSSCEILLRVGKDELNRKQADDIFSSACANGNATICHKGFQIFRSDDQLDRAEYYALQACARGYPDPCIEAAQMRHQAGGSPLEVLTTIQKMCTWSQPSARGIEDDDQLCDAITSVEAFSNELWSSLQEIPLRVVHHPDGSTTLLTLEKVLSGSW